jgi:hypothetical protein
MVSRVPQKDELRTAWSAATFIFENAIRTVEAVMEQHGFVDDVAPEIRLPTAKKSTDTLDWNKLLRRFNLLRLS